MKVCVETIQSLHTTYHEKHILSKVVPKFCCMLLAIREKEMLTLAFSENFFFNTSTKQLVFFYESFILVPTFS